MFRRKKEDNKQLLDAVTTLNQNARYIDNDRDGTPDYLQRIKLKSLVKSQADSNLAEVDAKKEKEELVMRWRGYRYDPDEGSYVPSSPPMINEEGINKLSQALDSNINKITMTTNLTNEDVHEHTLFIMLDIVGWLADNQKNWEINSSDLNSITNQLDSLILYTLSKSVNDGQRRHVTDRTRITESKNIQGQAPLSV